MKQYQEDFPWTENKKVFCFTSFVSSTRSFDWDLDSLISGQIVNSFGQGKYTVIWLSVREFKNHASRNHVSTSSYACWELRNWSPATWRWLINIDYYRLLSIIGLSINYVCYRLLSIIGLSINYVCYRLLSIIGLSIDYVWIECPDDNLERCAVWVFESMGKVGFSKSLPRYR